MDNANTPESVVTDDANVLTLEQLNELAASASTHPAVAPPLRALVPALVALVLEQKAIIDTLKD